MRLITVHCLLDEISLCDFMWIKGHLTEAKTYVLLQYLFFKFFDILPYFIQPLLKAVWALGNIAGDNLKYRNSLVDKYIVVPLQE